MKKIFLVALLSLAFAACDAGTNDNNSNSNAKPAPTIEQSTPAPVAPSPEASPAAKPSFKAGDKVKVMINGSSTEATVLSVDEKAGKVTVKVEGQSGEKTFAISEVTRQ